MFLDEFDANRPATMDVADSVQAELGIPLPQDYVEFMLRANGGEGFINGNSYVMLWKLDELCEFNRDYEVAQYCDGILLFGSNGGGEAFGFDLRAVPYRVVQVPFLGMNHSLIEKIGASFSEFLLRSALSI